MRLFEDIIDDVKDIRDVQDDQSSSEIIGANSDYIEEDTNPEIDRSYRFIMVACYSKDVDDKEWKEMLEFADNYTWKAIVVKCKSQDFISQVFEEFPTFKNEVVYTDNDCVYIEFDYSNNLWTFLKRINQASWILSHTTSFYYLVMLDFERKKIINSAKIGDLAHAYRGDRLISHTDEDLFNVIQNRFGFNDLTLKDYKKMAAARRKHKKQGLVPYFNSRMKRK